MPLYPKIGGLPHTPVPQTHFSATQTKNFPKTTVPIVPLPKQTTPPTPITLISTTSKSNPKTNLDILASQSSPPGTQDTNMVPKPRSQTAYPNRMNSHDREARSMAIRSPHI